MKRRNVELDKAVSAYAEICDYNDSLLNEAAYLTALANNAIASIKDEAELKALTDRVNNLRKLIFRAVRNDIMDMTKAVESVDCPVCFKRDSGKAITKFFEEVSKEFEVTEQHAGSTYGYTYTLEDAVGWLGVYARNLKVLDDLLVKHECGYVLDDKSNTMEYLCIKEEGK